SGERRLALGVALEGLEAAGRRTRHAGRLDRLGADNEERQPAAAFVVGGRPVRALEDDLLDPAVRRDLDRVPDRQGVVGDDVMRFVDAPVHGQLDVPGLRRRPRPRRLLLDGAHRVSLNSEWMTGLERVQAALALRVGDRPPVGAWGHTYKEDRSPADLAAATIDRARKCGWDFVKFQPRASSFAEAFGSEYTPSGHRLKGPVLVKEGVPDIESWRSVALVNPKALDDQVESIGIVARELGPSVPLIQTVFSPLTVAG